MSFITDLAVGIASRAFGVFKAGAAFIVGRVLAAFGLTLVTFNGVLPGLKSFVQGYYTALPAEKLEFLNAIGLGQAMTMILSALAVRLAWKVFVIPKSIADTMPGAGT